MGELLEQAGLLLDRIQALHGELAESPAPGGLQEAELLALLQERADLGPTLGTALIAALASGAVVTVETLKAAPVAGLVAPEETDTEPTAETEPDSPADTSSEEVKEEGTAASADPAHSLQMEPAPEPEPAAVVPERKPAPVASLMALAQRGIGGAPSPKSQADLKPVSKLLRHLGRPVPITTDAGAKKLLRIMDQEIGGVDAWIDLPQLVQKALLGLMAALARHVQDEFDGPPPLVVTSTLPGVFSQMTRFSKEERPGFVAGLSRRNPPEHANTWIGDAGHWFGLLEDSVGSIDTPEEGTPESALAALEKALAEDVEDRKELVALVKKALETNLSQSDGRLLDLLTPHQSLLKGARGLKTLKTALKNRLRDEDDFEEAQDKGSPVPASWPHFDLTLNKRAVIVGGDPRPESAKRIKEAFCFDNVEWEGAEVRRTLALARRIQGGSVDVVILLLRFISHRHQSVLKPACSDAGVQLIIVESGYGVDAIRRGIERMSP